MILIFFSATKLNDVFQSDSAKVKGEKAVFKEKLPSQICIGSHLKRMKIQRLYFLLTVVKLK